MEATMPAETADLVNRVVRALDQYIDAKFAMHATSASAKRPADPDDENSGQTAARAALNRRRNNLRAALTDLSVETFEQCVSRGLLRRKTTT